MSQVVMLLLASFFILLVVEYFVIDRYLISQGKLTAAYNVNLILDIGGYAICAFIVRQKDSISLVGFLLVALSIYLNAHFRKKLKRLQDEKRLS